MKRNQEVIVSEVKEIKNGAYQLTLEQKYEREGNPGAVVGFFMEGHPGINSGAGKLITWQSVSADKMKQYNFIVFNFHFWISKIYISSFIICCIF